MKKRIACKLPLNCHIKCYHYNCSRKSDIFYLFLNQHRLTSKSSSLNEIWAVIALVWHLLDMLALLH